MFVEQITEEQMRKSTDAVRLICQPKNKVSDGKLCRRVIQIQMSYFQNFFFYSSRRASKWSAEREFPR